jgi:hypothetical protein
MVVMAPMEVLMLLMEECIVEDMELILGMAAINTVAIEDTVNMELAMVNNMHNKQHIKQINIPNKFRPSLSP